MGIIFLPSVVMVNFLGCDASTIEFCLAVFVVCASTASSIFSFYISWFTTLLAIGLKPLTADISGNYASVIFGFVNFIGNFAGFAAPKIMAFFLTGKNQGLILHLSDKNMSLGEPTNWNMVFALPAGVFTVALGIFIAYGTAETRVWAVNKKTSLQPENSNRKETILESSLSPKNAWSVIAAFYCHFL